MRAFALAVVLAFVACDQPAAPPPPPPAVKPEFPPLPELKPSEDFSKDGFMELPAGGPVKFAWDLKENTHHNYTYEQEAHIVMTVSDEGRSVKVTSRTQWKGGAEVIGGGTRGEISFLATPVAQWNNNQPLSSEELNKVPRMLFQIPMLEDGSFGVLKRLTGQEDPKLVVFFALPGRDLKPDEKAVRDVHMAQVPGDSQYHGRQEITHAGRRKVGRHECVKLMSWVDLEATPPGDGHGRLTGWVAAYFDPKEGMFARIDAAFVMAVDVRREVRPADPTAPVTWHMNRAQADLRVTFLLKD